MAKLTEEMIKEARKMDVLTYLKTFEPNELVQISDYMYSTKTHDSLKISNGKWMWWSRGFGGHTALDYLIKVRGLGFREAVQMITGQVAKQPPVSLYPGKKELRLPEKSDTNDKVIKYLTGRGIDEEIIKECIEKGIIYQAKSYGNVVFVGKDEEGKPRYATFRSCSSARIMGDVGGSRKDYSFRLMTEDNANLHLFESAIDLLSYATIAKRNGRDYRNYNLVSLGGIYVPKGEKAMTRPKAIEMLFRPGNKIKRIYIHFDNDDAGRNASVKLKELLDKQFEVKDAPPPYGKDFNDYLQQFLELEKEKEAWPK